MTDGGFRVMGPASSVDTALDLLRDQRPDAAVLDFTLGGEKVTPVPLLLKSLGVPFILASANTVDLAQHAIFTEVDLGKPTDFKRLIEFIRAL